MLPPKCRSPWKKSEAYRSSRASVAAVVRLTDHDAGNRGSHAQAMNVIIAEGVNTAGVTFTTYIEESLHHGEGIFKFAFIFEESQEGRQFFTGEEVFLANIVDAAARYCNELAVFRDFKASSKGQFLGADATVFGRRCPVSSHMTFFSFSASSSLAR